MTIYETLRTTGLPCAYSHFKEPQELPYIVYIGDGQNVLAADNTYYWTHNAYQIEYYFKVKNERNEAAIESALLAAGFPYQKSEDTYLEDQGVFLIYYNV